MTINEMISKFRIKYVVKDGQEMIHVLKKPTQKQIEELKKAKPDIIAELKRRAAEEEERKEAEKVAKQQELEDLKNGTKKIKLSYHDGEYLSGYSTYGCATDLLEELGLAEYVSGWGTYVDNKLVEALGEEFTYQQAVEYSRPAKEAEAAKKAKAETERQAKFDEAMASSKPVELHRYTAPCNDPEEECSLDIVTEYAMPDGSVKVTRMHTW